VCHTIIVENKDNDIQYNASSPDELALANAARYFGVIFQKRDSNNMIKIKNTLTGEEDKYELLNVIEFTSTRKRMSVIVRSPDNKILCMTKGADSIIIPRLLPWQEQLIEHTVSFLEECANEGLRTLLIAQKEVDPDFYEEWNKKYSNALSSFKDRQKQIDEVSEIIENDFILIGSTAIEDKLQDNVGEVISFIKQAGIKLWVLTGDKIETAINIGFSCEVLDKEMEIFIINETKSNMLIK